MLHGVRQGDPINADQYNLLVDAIMALQRATDNEKGFGSRLVAFENVGAATIKNGCPCYPDRAGDPTGLTTGYVARQRPQVNGNPLVYVCRGADVATGKWGAAEYLTHEPAFVRVDQAVNVGDSVGIKSGVTPFYKNYPGFRALRYHGDYYGDGATLWAWITREPYLQPFEITGVAGDVITVESVDEDGNKSGTSFTMPNQD